ncbi:unnamed protein product [Aspergillus oryzae var. brunneus]|uniref:Unnamed protein product n=1 Tax=Aspergillus oryzae var. brunneus TaxID=332754 RepID=A0ABQ6KMK6_ASPOZ|nr:unnamed protein product [Aspergillus oryzae]GMG43806.1 unnamed protein product [Aspergillus oryzae var. brunneus]
MAPITEEAVSGLKDIIGKLEARVEELESRLSNGFKPKSVAEHMRMVLMGPPGAGMIYDFPFPDIFGLKCFGILTSPQTRQGHPGTCT